MRNTTSDLPNKVGVNATIKKPRARIPRNKSKPVQALQIASVSAHRSALQRHVQTTRTFSDPESIFDRVASALQTASLQPNFKQTAANILDENIEALVMAWGVGNQCAIQEAVGEKYRPLVVKFTRQLIEEYQCKTASELALAELIGHAYVSIIENSILLTSMREGGFLYSCAGYAVTSKELDRAERHFQANLELLREMKAPPVSVNVLTQNAFIAHNQINSIGKENK